MRSTRIMAPRNPMEPSSEIEDFVSPTKHLRDHKLCSGTVMLRDRASKKKSFGKKTWHSRFYCFTGNSLVLFPSKSSYQYGGMSAATEH
eukprot:g6560.t1